MTIYFAVLLALTALVALGLTLEPLLGSNQPRPAPLGARELARLAQPLRRRPDAKPDRSPVNRGQLLGLLGALAFVGLAVLLAAAALRSGDPVRSEPVARLESEPSADLFVSADGQTLVLGSDAGIWAAAPQAPDPMVIASLSAQPVAASTGAVLLAADGSRWGPEPLERLQLPTDIVIIGASRSGVRVAAADAQGRIHISGDGGASWRQGDAGAPAGLRALSPSDADERIWAATDVQGVLVGDGDAGWGGANGFVNGALPTTVVFDVHYDPDSGDSTAGAAGTTFLGAIYAATDRGLFRSLDGGLAWAPLPGGFASRAVFGNGRQVWAVDATGNLFRSDDGGRTWA